MNKNILVVEDDEAIRESVIELLEVEGYMVNSAGNGQEALDYLCLANNLPDLILLDLMMPIKDGFAFCMEQARDELISEVPVIIMSADGHVKEKQAKTHALAYIKKPLDIDVLLNAIKNILSI